MCDTTERVADKIAPIVSAQEKHKSILQALKRADNKTYISNRTIGARPAAPPKHWGRRKRRPPNKALSPSDAEELLEGGEVLEIHYAIHESVDRFLDALKNMIRSSRTCEATYRTNEYKTKIGKTVESIFALDDGQPSETTYLPKSATCEETDGVQPVLYAIVRGLAKKIATIRNNDGTRNDSTAQRDHILREQYLPPECDQREPQRYIDLVLNMEEENFAAAVEIVLGIPAEVKPLDRQGEDFHKLHKQGGNQVMSHLAKQLIEAFNFAGVGVDSVATGLVMTMVSVEVIQLEQTGVGTPDTKLVKKSTGIQPLYDKETTLHILADMQGTKRDKIVELLFPEQQQFFDSVV